MNTEWILSLQSLSKREREDREQLISMLVTMFQISKSIDNGSVFKTAFQTPAKNRQSDFTVKFTPQFGTLARPKKNINTKISSMVFGQAQTEMVMASKRYSLDSTLSSSRRRVGLPEEEEKDGKKESKGLFSCAVFYGVGCKPDIAKSLAQKLMEQFIIRFDKEITRLLTMNDEMDDGSDSMEEHSLDLIMDGHGSDGGMQGDKKDKEEEGGRSNQEYIMAQFKSFDEIAVRYVTQKVDRRDRKISHHRQYQHHGGQRHKKGVDDMKLEEEHHGGY